MGTAVNANLVIQQGATFKLVLRWEDPTTLVYHTIQAIANSAPASLTVPGHTVPDGWSVQVTGAKGMKQINAVDAKKYHGAVVKDGSTIELNDIDATSFGLYVAGSAQLRYYAPVDLAGFTGRLQARATVNAADTLLDLNTANGGVTVDQVNKTITIEIAAADTSAITWKQAVYDLEMVSPTGVVTRLLEGKFSVVPEVTR